MQDFGEVFVPTLERYCSDYENVFRDGAVSEYG